MENASKALLMAGGVLIAIITIGLLAKTFGVVSLFQKEQLTKEEQEQLVAFNEQYAKYLGKYVYGTEVITVINKSLDNKTHTIKTIIKFNDGYEYNKKEWNKNKKEYEEKKIEIKPGKEMTITNENDEAQYIIDGATGNFESLARRAFKCTEIEYDSYNRVKSIKFEEKEWKDLD